MEQKYINFGNRVVVIFSKLINHNHIHVDTIYDSLKPVSAGFCTIKSEGTDIKVAAYGESVSLGLRSRDTDAELIKNQIANE